MAEGVLVWAVSGKVSDCNVAAERIFTMSRAQLLGRETSEFEFDLVDAAGQPVAQRQNSASTTLITGQPIELEIGFRRGDGTQTWLRESCRALRNEASEIIGAVSTFVDVTALQVVSQRLSAVVAGANVGSWSLDAITGIATRSDNWFRLLDVAPEAVPPTFKALRSFVHPDDLPLYDAIPLQWSSEIPYFVELRIRTGSGEWKWFQTRGRARLGANGKPLEISGVIVDVDARKRMEASLQLSLEENIRLVSELRAALEKINRLEGLLPICLSCKSIRDGTQWVSLEAYISERSQASFTHGICPECFIKELESENKP
jgi:PAS domain S-box-containing protein